MNELPGDLLYTKDHEWLRQEADGSVTVGITEHAATALGDLVYVELPEVGQDCEAGGEMAVVESVKAASDVYAPVGGEVVAVNSELEDSPELVNQDPYGEGWLIRLAPAAPSELDNLMDGDAYEAMVAEEEG